MKEMGIEWRVKGKSAILLQVVLLQGILLQVVSKAESGVGTRPWVNKVLRLAVFCRP